ncbi:MAG: rRNA maturation RNase YbeY [Pseudomonadota bacterium]
MPADHQPGANAGAETVTADPGSARLSEPEEPDQSIALEFVRLDERWAALELPVALLVLAIDRELGPDAVAGGSAAVALSDDAHLQDLNRQHRGQDKPTNVLSFPSPPMPGADGGTYLGDIAISFDTVASEAEAARISLKDHATHMLLHGLLHLLGHDHEDDAEAERMEAMETRILARLGIIDPYADRDVTTAAKETLDRTTRSVG